MYVRDSVNDFFLSFDRWLTFCCHSLPLERAKLMYIIKDSLSEVSLHTLNWRIGLQFPTTGVSFPQTLVNLDPHHVWPNGMESHIEETVNSQNMLCRCPLFSQNLRLLLFYICKRLYLAIRYISYISRNKLLYTQTTMKNMFNSKEKTLYLIMAVGIYYLFKCNQFISRSIFLPIPQQKQW